MHAKEELLAHPIHPHWKVESIRFAGPLLADCKLNPFQQDCADGKKMPDIFGLL
jgi:hypothetical protein